MEKFSTPDSAKKLEVQIAHLELEIQELKKKYNSEVSKVDKSEITKEIEDKEKKLGVLLESLKALLSY